MQNNFLSFLKDCLDAFQVAYKYAELDFYKLRGEVIALLDKARAKGYGNPDYCELKIKVVNSYETDVLIQAFYKGADDKFYRFKKDLDLGKLVNIPHTVKQRLSNDKEVSIRLTDFQNLYSIGENLIVPVGDFRNIQVFTFKNVERIPIRKEVFIKDELFYYVVKCTYVYDNEERETRAKYYGTIKNLPDEIIDKLSADEEKECTLDVTQND